MKNKTLNFAKAVVSKINEGKYKKRAHNGYSYVVYSTDKGNLVLWSNEDFLRVDNTFTIEFTKNTDVQETVCQYSNIKPTKAELRGIGFNEQEQYLILMLMLNVLKNKKALFERRTEQMKADYDYYINKIEIKIGNWQ